MSENIQALVSDTSFSIMLTKFIHVVTNDRIAFFFWLIFHCEKTYLYRQTYTQISTYHIVFTHSPINEHLGCFYALATVTNTKMNMRCYRFLFRDFILILFPSDIHPEMGLLDHMAQLFLFAEKTPYYFP